MPSLKIGESLTEKERQRLKAEILHTCEEHPEVLLAVSVLRDVLEVLRTRYGWSEEQVRGFLEALNEEQDKRFGEEAMDGEEE